MSGGRFLIVDKRILPACLTDVLKARKLIESGAVKDVSAAVKQMGISRSTYYKYKDAVFEPDETAAGRKAVVSMLLSHETGVLSSVLGLFSNQGANILAITQSLPIGGKASVTLSADVSRLKCDARELMRALAALAGVEQARLVAIE